MHVVNPFDRPMSIQMPSLPSIWHGQVPTAGVIPFDMTDVRRTTSQYAVHPTDQLPSPLDAGTSAAKHASARAKAVLGKLFSSAPSVPAAIVNSTPPQPLQAIVGAAEASVGTARDAVQTALAHAVSLTRSPGPAKR